MKTTLSAKAQLESLLSEIDATDPEIMPPRNKKEPNDKLIGIVTDDYLKKVFSLSSFYRREGKRTVVDIEASGEEPTENKQFIEHKNKHDVLLEIFWMLLRYHVDHWSGSVGIRANWEVVVTPDSSSNDPTPMIRKLLGLD
jgi:hypothetical protein